MAQSTRVNSEITKSLEMVDTTGQTKVSTKVKYLMDSDMEKVPILTQRRE